MPDRIPNAPLREAFLESGLTLSEVCYRLGWTRMQNARVIADVSPLKRALGLQPWTNGQGRSYTSRLVGTEKAARILRALDLDPIDFDL